MSITTSIRGITVLNEEMFKKHSAVLIACVDAGIKKLPKETAEYFGDDECEDYLLVRKLELEVEIKSTKISSNNRVEIEINVSDIPENVNKIIILASY